MQTPSGRRQQGKQQGLEEKASVTGAWCRGRLGEEQASEALGRRFLYLGHWDMVVGYLASRVGWWEAWRRGYICSVTRG